MQRLLHQAVLQQLLQALASRTCACGALQIEGTPGTGGEVTGRQVITRVHLYMILTQKRLPLRDTRTIDSGRLLHVLSLWILEERNHADRHHAREEASLGDDAGLRAGKVTVGITATGSMEKKTSSDLDDLELHGDRFPVEVDKCAKKDASPDAERRADGVLLQRSREVGVGGGSQPAARVFPGSP